MAALSGGRKKFYFGCGLAAKAHRQMMHAYLFLFSPRVEDCIKSGLDSELVDPDSGASIEHKCQQLAEASHPAARPDVLFPESGWTKSLQNLPASSCPTYNYNIIYITIIAVTVFLFIYSNIYLFTSRSIHLL